MLFHYENSPVLGETYEKRILSNFFEMVFSKLGLLLVLAAEIPNNFLNFLCLKIERGAGLLWSNNGYGNVTQLRIEMTW